jgi:hypothetical protein
MSFLIGLDLGQQRDPSALVIVEAVDWTPPPPAPPCPSPPEPLSAPPPRRKRRFLLDSPAPGPIIPIAMQGRDPAPPVPPPSPPERRYHVRHSERPRLGTPYPVVVEHVGRVLAALRGDRTLIVDATGVGRPVVELFEAARIYPVAVTLTSGETAVQEGSRFRVPKRDLVTTVEVLLQERRLKIGQDAPGREALVDELLSFRASVTAQGRDTFGAEGGSHDDLVIALALACWYGHQTERRPATSPTVGISQPWEDLDDPDALWLGDPEYRFGHGYQGGGSRFIGGGCGGISPPRYIRFR